MTTKDGGPAFPVTGATFGQNGMSLRDWFAGQALLGMMHNGYVPRQYLDPKDTEGNPPPRGHVVSAYRIADAMLAERSKREE